MRSGRAGATLPWVAAFATMVTLAGCATPPSRVSAPPPVPTPDVVQTGPASWYGEPHHGRRTASGETYDMHQLTAAHPTLPFGARVLVTNLKNDRSVEVRINDRGPHVAGRIIDVSYAAAQKLGAISGGTFPAWVRVLSLPSR
jgi:rare lipoprotein A